jgi:hypothetical protein
VRIKLPDYNALNSKENELVLLTLRGYTLLGTPLPQAFKLLAQIEKNKKFLKVYKMAAFQIHEKGIEPSEVMVKLSLLNTFEAFLLKNSLSTRQAIDNIIDIRKNGSNYEKKLFFMFIGSIVWFFGTLSALPYLSAKIQLVESTMVKNIKQQQGVDISGQIELPAWVGNPLADIAIYTIIAAVIFLIGTYIYYHKTDPFKLYPLFKGKAYSDIAIFLNIFNVLKSTGKDTKHVIDILIKSGQFKRELPLLLALKRARIMSDVFVRFNYPTDIVYFISMGEKNKILWKSMENLISFSKDAGTISLEKMEFFYKKPIFFVSMGFAIFIALDLMLLAFTAMNLFLTGV